ncbi:MAG TPA: hypothetical protein VG889_10020 [Rhizomicrobium sp.]|nr:hypothetical protein [Rhizomicrobium sp.]
MLKYIGLAAVLLVVLAGAAYTKPNRDALHEAATAYADDQSLVGSVATRVTGLFGNDTFDDYIFFTRYRVYVGKDPEIDCFGAFGKTSCSKPKPEEHAAS